MPPERAGEGPAAPDASDGPATQSELRTLRRWTIVAGVWAVAATAVGLIALLDTSGEDATKQVDAAKQQITDAEQDLDARIKELEGRIDDLPQSTDVSKLQDRLGKAEEDAAAAADDAKGAEDNVKDLEERVQTLEDDAGSTDSGDDGGFP